MAELDIRRIEDSFVIHFGGEFGRINAYTLASTLVGIADAAKAANGVLNPGYEIEVLVEALGEGSFLTRIRAVYREAGNLFTGENLRTIVLAVIASFIYDATFGRDAEIVIVTTDQEVVFEQGDTRVIIPREVHEAMEAVRDEPKFRGGVSRAAEAVEGDVMVESFGISTDGDPEHEYPPISRDQMPALTGQGPLVDAQSRVVEEQTVVRIVRAILERSRRRWEFVWHGVRIAAPITDDQFYDDFIAHRVVIAPGDALEVRLSVRQDLDPGVGIYLNAGYEVVEVIRHIPRAEQDELL